MDEKEIVKGGAEKKQNDIDITYYKETQINEETESYSNYLPQKKEDGP